MSKRICPHHRLILLVFIILLGTIAPPAWGITVNTTVVADSANPSGPVNIGQITGIAVSGESGADAVAGGKLVFPQLGLVTVASGGADYIQGLRAQGGAIEVLSAGGVKVVTDGLHGYAFASSGSASSITVTGNAAVETSGTEGVALGAWKGGKITVGSATVKTSGGRGAGLSSDNSGSSVTVMGNAAVETSGTRAIGFGAWDGGTITVGSATVKTSGDVAHGLYSDNPRSSVMAKSASVETAGANAYGFATWDGATITVGSAKLKTSGGKSHGLNSDGSGSSIVVTDSASVETSGEEANGLAAWDGATITVGSTTVGITGPYGAGLFTSGLGSSITVKGSATIQASATSNDGLAALDGGSITVNGGTVTASGADGYGVYMVSPTSDGNTSTIRLTGVAVESVKGQGAVLEGGTTTLTLAKGSSLKGAGGSYAILAQDHQCEIHDGALHRATVAATGSTINGNIANISGKVVEPGKAPDRLLSVTLAEGSVLTGGANTDRVTATGLIGSLGTTTVTIDSTSRWAVTGSSWVTNLGNSGTVSLRDGKASGWTYKTLAVGNLDGSGAFVMGGDVVKRKGDLLDVALSSKGTFTIDYKNDPAAAAAPKNALLLVRSGETPVPDAANPGGTLPKGVFAATFSALPNSVEIGGFVYTVGRAADSKVVTINDPNKNNWYLYPAGQDPVPPTPTPTSAADAGMNMLYAHYLLGAQENHTLMQRMGELQRGTALSDGWVRFYGGKYDVSGTTARQPFDMSYWGVQAGYDRRSPRPDGSALYTGLFVGHTEGSPDFIRGSGNADATSLGLYGLWTSPSGFYADLVLKHTWHRGDYTVLDTKGKAVSANDVDTEGFGASLEVGRRFYLGADRQSRQGFYIEPQGQLSWNRYSSMDYRTSAGLRVHSDSYDSTVGRIGLVLGHNMVHGDRSTNVYGKIMYEKELGGDVTYRLNGVPVKEDFGGSWWTYGIGVTGQFGADKTYYLEVQRSDGDRFDQEWQINAGLRWSF